MSYKNLLQEYCQKKDIAFPSYITQINSSSLPAIYWSTEVTVANNTFTSSKSHFKKTDAEKDAAEVAYKYITGTKHNTLVFDTKTNNLLSRDILSRDILFNNIDTNLETKQYTKPDTKSYTNIETKLDKLHISSTTKFHNNLANSYTSEPKSILKTIVILDVENLQPSLSVIPKHFEIHCFYSQFSTVDDSKYINIATIHKIDSGVTEATDHLITYTVGKWIHKLNTYDNKFIIVSRDKASCILVQLLNLDGYLVTHYKSTKEFEQLCKDTIMYDLVADAV